MGDLNDVMAKIAELDAAIENALEIEVAEVIKNYLVESAYQNVYEAYTPEFYSRRYGNGGILDKDSIDIDVHGNELIAMDTLPGVEGPKGWQQLYGGDVPDGRLAEAIASGDPKYNMDKAGSRPFHEIAKELAIESGEIEDALRRGLKRQGIDASGYTFKIV